MLILIFLVIIRRLIHCLQVNKLISLCLGAFLLGGCSTVDDDRIPVANVYLDLGNQGYWDVYGVHGLGQYRYFIREDRVPANFPYAAMSYTGYGGILLVTDISGYPLAYDLSCPVEAKPTVRVRYQEEDLCVECPVCGSRYNVNEYNGSPISGKAFDLKYGLRRYKVARGTQGGYIITF